MSRYWNTPRSTILITVNNSAFKSFFHLNYFHDISVSDHFVLDYVKIRILFSVIILLYTLTINFKVIRIDKFHWWIGENLIFHVCNRFVVRNLIFWSFISRLWVGQLLLVCRLGINFWLDVWLWLVGMLWKRWVSGRIGIFVRFGFIFVLNVSDVTMIVSLVCNNLLWTCCIKML